MLFSLAGKPETIRRITAQALKITFSLAVVQGAISVCKSANPIVAGRYNDAQSI